MFQYLCKKDYADALSKWLKFDTNYLGKGVSPISLMRITQAPYILTWFKELIEKKAFYLFTGIRNKELLKMLSLPTTMGKDFFELLLYADASTF